MRKLLSIAYMLFTILTHAQITIDVDKNDHHASSMYYTVGGTPMLATKYVKVVSGSPYFNEGYMKGKVVMSKGSVHDSVYLRLDLVDNSLLYIGPGGQEIIAES